MRDPKTYPINVAEVVRAQPIVQRYIRPTQLALHYTHNLAEGAGASTLMAAVKLKDYLQGKNVVLQMSGCNASAEEISLAADNLSYCPM